MRTGGGELRGGGAMAAGQGGTLKGRHFTAEVILWALRWYLAFPISYRDLAAMLSDRGISVDHTTLFRWVQAYAATQEELSLRPTRIGNLCQQVQQRRECGHGNL